MTWVTWISRAIASGWGRGALRLAFPMPVVPVNTL